MKPTVFVGSSSEGLEFACALQAELQHGVDVTLWTQGVFELGRSTLQSLVNILSRFDFAVLVATPDDFIVQRDQQGFTARDNVLFELGLFIGGLGHERTFLLAERQVRLPSDLQGVTIAQFDSTRSDRNWQAAVGPAAREIATAIDRRGPLPKRGIEQMQRAAETVEGVSSDMEQLIQLLAQSRVAELEIITGQFAPRIEAPGLEKIKADLRDLQRAVAARRRHESPGPEQ